MRQEVIILMADDDADDRFLTQSAFEDNDIANPIHFVENGQELLDYLHRRGKYEDLTGTALPGLILLDLNMPKMDGREALQIIKQTAELRHIPIVVLTTSKAEADILDVYLHGANCFISKPISFEGLLEMTRSLGDFWLRTATIPLRK
ncbi:Response regulator receiver domain-containing protein [Pseudarcicella hirudinis]|uniref:Response regulator receiver domain-containing protein n=1 Tax=Pseudarcicella hirudinis TaxID=1079859 RepID=A0A1I5XDZ9_9BACT|nr:response regulator [Pseudarcicella hirudinis]SFQ30161.1 Response regulator receiver domain-containing protein [Pseudarcicella hirudinis]